MQWLMRFELKKIVRSPLVLLGLVILFVFNAVSFWGTSVPVQMARSHDQEDYVRGLAAVRLEQDLAEKYGPVLTDAAVQRMLDDFALSQEFQQRIGGVNAAYIMNNFWQQAVHTHFAQENGRFNGLSVTDVFGEADIVLGYSHGWLVTAEYMLRVMLLACVLLLVALAPVFAGEYEGMDALLLTARYGKSKLIGAKITASLLFALGLALFLLAVNYGVAYLCFGSGGLAASIGFAPDNPFALLAPNMSCGQLIAWQGGLFLCAVLVLTALILALSAALANRYMALVASAAVFFLPLVVSVSPNSALYRPLLMLPANLVLANRILAAGTLAGHAGWLYAWCALPLSALLALAGFWCARWFFSRHQVR